jgi:hypothetical protein
MHGYMRYIRMQSFSDQPQITSSNTPTNKKIVYSYTADCKETFTTTKKTSITSLIVSSAPNALAKTIVSKLFLATMEYRDHSKDIHGITESCGSSIEEHYLLSNVQNRFWCGFFCKIIELKEKGRLGAWEEMRSHREGVEEVLYAHHNYVHMITLMKNS